MLLTIASGIETAAQFFTVVLIFVFVLAITYILTKWMANYQKGKSTNANIELIEVSKINGNKYIEIVRCGEKYLAIAVCKDTVTLLCELNKDQIKFEDISDNKGFKELLEKAKAVDILEKAKDLKNNK